MTAEIYLMIRTMFHQHILTAFEKVCFIFKHAHVASFCESFWYHTMVRKKKLLKIFKCNVYNKACCALPCLVLNLVTAVQSDNPARDWAVFKESNILFSNGYFYNCTSVDQKVLCPYMINVKELGCGHGLINVQFQHLP
jgi:hypothetical protein